MKKLEGKFDENGDQLYEITSIFTGHYVTKNRRKLGVLTPLTSKDEKKTDE